MTRLTMSILAVAFSATAAGLWPDTSLGQTLPHKHVLAECILASGVSRDRAALLATHNISELEEFLRIAVLNGHRSVVVALLVCYDNTWTRESGNTWKNESLKRNESLARSIGEKKIAEIIETFIY